MALAKPAAFGILANVTRKCRELPVALNDPIVPVKFKEMLPDGAVNRPTLTPAALSRAGNSAAQARSAASPTTRANSGKPSARLTVTI